MIHLFLTKIYSKIEPEINIMEALKSVVRQLLRLKRISKQNKTIIRVNSKKSLILGKL